MIRYTLRCAKDHHFESWFADSAAYDKQAKRGLVTCPNCGSTRVEKSLMAPQLGRTERQKSSRKKAATPAVANEASPIAMMSDGERELRTKLKELREHVVKNATDVGTKFPEEARKMHYGESEARSIYGEASFDDAKALHEEGIDVLPLPVLPDDRN